MAGTLPALRRMPCCSILHYYRGSCRALALLPVCSAWEELVNMVGQRLYSRSQFIRAAGAACAWALVSGCSRVEAPDEKQVDAADAQAFDQSFQAFDHARSVAEIQQSGTLVVGVCTDAKPYGYLDIIGNYQGFDYSLANKVRWDIGAGVRYVHTDPSDVAPYLLSHRVDMVICSSAAPTADVEQAFPFVAPRQALVVKDGTQLTGVEALESMAVAVCRGTHAQQYLEGIGGAKEVLAFDAYTDAYQALLSQTAQVLCVDQYVARSFVLANPGHVVALDDLGEACPAGIMVASGNDDLLTWADHETYVLVNDGYVKGMYDKHVVPELVGTDYSHTLLPVEQDV